MVETMNRYGLPADKVRMLLDRARIRFATPGITDQQIDCRHPAHNPPTYSHLVPGTHEHRCSACGKRSLVVVKDPTYEVL